MVTWPEIKLYVAEGQEKRKQIMTVVTFKSLLDLEVLKIQNLAQILSCYMNR